MGERYPDGIAESHVSIRRWHRRANPLSFIILGSVILIALSGALGGLPNPADRRRG